MPTLYLDMDGVLTDFNKNASEILKASKQEREEAQKSGHWSDQDWQTLKTVDHLFRNLPKTNIADDLVDLARKFRDDLGWKISTLTAVPKGNDVPDSFQDKVEWMKEHYPDIRVRFGPFSVDKQKHAQPNDILVDDRKDNCEQWEKAGGIAIKVDESNRQEALAKLWDIYAKKLSLKRLASL